MSDRPMHTVPGAWDKLVELFARGDAAIQEGRFHDAIEAFTEGLAIDDHFRSAGFSVAHDAPYRGGHSTAHYGRPSEGVHAVQLELNRALYMDERDSRPKDQHFEALRASLRQLVARLGRLPRPTPSSNTG